MGKRYQAALTQRGENAPKEPKEAIALLKSLAAAKFDETMNLSFNLGIDPKKSDQLIRGSVLLPKGSGKTVRVAVVTQGDALQAAQQEGADTVGGDELLEKIKGGWLGFDVLLATPDMMGAVGKLGKLLGQKGLMPSPKSGTVTTDIAKTVREFKAGKVEYRTDKTGNVHVPVGKRSFSPEDLFTNLLSVYTTILLAKPSSVKGIYIKSMTLAPTMGPGVRLDLGGLERERKALKEGA